MPPDFRSEHQCAGKCIAHCKQNDLPLPILLHGLPLVLSKTHYAPGDPLHTLYPGDELPDNVLSLIKNTRKGKDWSQILWVDAFLFKLFEFLENHKGGVLSKGMPFALFAMHPST